MMEVLKILLDCITVIIVSLVSFCLLAYVLDQLIVWRHVNKHTKKVRYSEIVIVSLTIVYSFFHVFVRIV